MEKGTRLTYKVKLWISVVINTMLFHRCVKPNSTGTPGQFDSSEVQDQLKECCVVETTQQRKSGYSACWTQEHFVRR